MINSVLILILILLLVLIFIKKRESFDNNLSLENNSYLGSSLPFNNDLF